LIFSISPPDTPFKQTSHCEDITNAPNEISTRATAITAVNTVAAEENANALIKYTMEERKSSDGDGSDVGIN
jgi:hypothetical protein